jgi:CHAT domain-containing protein
LVDLLKQNVSTPSKSPLTLKYSSVKEIQQIAQQQNATLVEYSIVSNKQLDILYIYVIQPSGEIEFRTVDLPQDISLEEFVTNGYFCILQDQCRGDVVTPAIGDFVKLNDDQFDQPWQVVDIQQDNLIIRQESWEEGVTIQRPMTDVAAIVNAYNRERLQTLHQLLIEPIAHLLPTDETDRVIFIPHQELFFVPFPALQDKHGDYLIEKHTILTAPSIEVLSLTHEQRQKLPDSVQGALVVGNPTMPTVQTRAGQEPTELSDLPHAKTEARKIAELLDTQALTGENATKTAIVPRLPQARMIHFATHGLLDDFKGLGVPGAIALGPAGTGEDNDGLLTAGEILEMKLNAELVVLSACKTGQGDITGDGVIGLSRSLVAAGVPSIIVSLWSVPDAPTADLMAEFYQNLEQTDDKAQALRQAMLTTMEQHPNPKDWAAFTLIGEAF